MVRTRPTGNGTEVVETHPGRCPNGHDWRPRGSHSPGWNGSARTWRCRTPGCDGLTIDDHTDDWVRAPGGHLVYVVDDEPSS